MNATNIEWLFYFVDKYGFIAVLILIVVISFFKQSKHLKKPAKHLGKLDLLEGSKKPDFKVEDLKRITAINLLLDNLLYLLNCDRACVFEFHNGGENSCGLPFRKFSATHEECQIGITRHATEYQQLPVGIIGGLACSLHQEQCVRCEDVSRIEDSNTSLYHLMHSREDKSLYCIPMWGPESKLFGFVSVEFCREKKNLTREQIHVLELQAAKICGIFLLEKIGCQITTK